MAQESCAIILPQFIAVCFIALTRWSTNNNNNNEQTTGSGFDLACFSFLSSKCLCIFGLQGAVCV